MNKYFYSWSPHVKKAKTVLDSGFHAMDSGFQVLESWFFVSGTWILDTNPYFDSEFLELHSGFQTPGFQIAQQKLEGFRIPDPEIRGGAVSKNFFFLPSGLNKGGIQES